jgi:dienelactone hydrolase
VRRSITWRASILLVAFPLAQVVAQATKGVPQPTAKQQSADPTTKKVLSPNDYSRWRSIEGAQISSDGKWVAYGTRLTNTLQNDSKPIVHLLNLDSNKDVEIANASNPIFSPDSRWVVYQVDSVATGRGRGGRGAGTPAGDSTQPAPPPSGAPPAVAPGGAPATGGRASGAPPAPARRMELRELATGRTQSWQNMGGATFSATSSYLLLRRRPAAGGGRGGRGGGGGPPDGPGAAGGNATDQRGTDAVLHDLTSGRSQFLGSVGDAAFNRKGDLLSYTVDAEARDGNGLFVIDLASGRTTALDNDAKIYSRLTWNDDGTGVAVLKGREVEKMRERGNMLVVVADVRAAAANAQARPATLDPTAAPNFPKGWVVSERAPISWSDDGKRVFFGAMQQTSTADTARRRNTDSIADVDVWRTADRRIQSVQMIRADADRNFTFRQAFDVAAAKFIPLADSTMRDLEVAAEGRWAVGRDTREFISDYKRPAADIYRVNTATGERTLMMKGQLIGQHIIGISPDGHYFVYWKDDKYQAYDLDAGTSKTIGAASPVSFVDVEFDHPGPKPSFGVEGYSADMKSVLVEHQYDLWALPLDGSAPRNLTNGVGTTGEIRFRLVRTDPIDSTARRAVRTGQLFDLTKPVIVAAYGEYTKKAGFYRLTGKDLKEVVYDDAIFTTPNRATKADRFLFTRQTFEEFPDLRVSGGDFKDARKISNVNPQQSEYMWGHRILFDYKNKDGLRLQGILALPDDYKPGEKRPMIVNFYEKNSQNMHRYSSPSFLTGMGSSPIEAVSRGYITMLPDVHFRTGSSHSDMLECVEAATRKVIEMGYVDPAHIGINGHSYGGEGVAFIGTRSKLFAAIGMGAGVTDLFTDFSQSWGWSYQVTGGSGANGNDYYLYGQGRWGVSPWDNPELYHFESALTHVREVSAPFLIMHGTADPTVSFSEGMNFYNALRYNGKNAVLLAYPGEGHGLRGLANRRDLTIRYFQFMDHYLKGAPAAKWMTDEQPFLTKEAVKGDPR